MDKMEKELKVLDEAQKAWEQKLDKEIKDEESIVRTIDSLTDSLYAKNKIRASFNERNFMIGLRVMNVPKNLMNVKKGNVEQVAIKQILLIITDIAKYNILGQKYTPAMVRADVDERYDMKANIRVAIEGWVRHITNTVKPDMLEE